jgi:uncharacterized damage-inducible protein DinB
MNHAAIRFTASRHIGSLAAVVALSFFPLGAAVAQEGLDAKEAAELKAKFMADLDTVHVKILALANAFPEDKYAWRPGEGVRSVAGALMHVAAEWYLFTPMLTGGTPFAALGPPMEANAKLLKIRGKTEVLDYLNKAWAYCRQQAEAADAARLSAPMPVFGRPMTLSERLFLMSGDQHEHLGQLIAYARVNGIVPPWSRK